MDRQVVTLRIPEPLLRKLDRLVAKQRKERGARWSRNDQLLLLLEQTVEEDARG